VVSITPAAGAKRVDGAAPITVTFSAPMSVKTPDPVLSPSVPGTWTASGHSLVFLPTKAYSPSTKVRVSVPSGPQGVRSTAGGLLTAPVTQKFKTGGYSQLALSEALADQGYLPMSFEPASSGTTSPSSTGSDPASQTPEGLAYNPPAGTFNWDSGYPRRLHKLWNPNRANEVLAGAVMAFQSQHNMTIDGKLTPLFWSKLFKAAADGQRNANGYSYAIASKSLPESLTIWHDGRKVFHSLANTGIPVSPTVDGNFPVYERLPFQIMRGTNPDGSTYADPVSYVSYFNGGDAVHYFPRGSYGWQQSLGCVELPFDSAKRAYPYLTYGSVVSVTG
jgi:peptidoglycan hydrolase-like protein with peptidoglycan-binding domain